jgi:hypothetical protein
MIVIKENEMRYLILFLGSVFLAAAAGFSATINVPDDYSGIQEAIEAAEDGDLILVGPGTYQENIDLLGKAISIVSSAGPVYTVIDGGDPLDPNFGAVVTFTSGETDETVVEGFTLINGTGNFSSGAMRGGAVYCRDASPMLVNNIIRGNTADMGGGIYCKYYSAPFISNCSIYGNEAVQQGGALRVYGSHPFIVNTVIHDNTAAEGGALHLSKSAPTLLNVTIWGNSASVIGGAIFCRYDSPALVTNCIVHGNSAPSGPQVYVGHTSNDPAPATFSHSDVDGGEAEVFLQADTTLNWGEGMIDADPRLVDPANHDFHLLPGSPCIDSGNNVPVVMDTDFEGDARIFNGIVDMGADESMAEALATNIGQIEASTGGSAQLTLGAGYLNGYRNYIVLGSMSGTEPGYPLPGNLVNLPLNWDLFTEMLFPLMNSNLLQDFLGQLDGDGVGAAVLNIPVPIPEAVGMTMYFAFALNDPWNYVSNPVEIEIVP